jgi:hypothetical protein
VLSFRATEIIVIGNRTQGRFRGCGLRFCDLLFEKNNFDIGAVLLSCLVSDLQEPPSPGIELRTLFPEFWPFVFSSWSHTTPSPHRLKIPYIAYMSLGKPQDTTLANRRRFKILFLANMYQGEPHETMLANRRRASRRLSSQGHNTNTAFQIKPWQASGRHMTRWWQTDANRHDAD